MERTISVEDKIKRAEEIYNRRQKGKGKISETRVNVNSKKDVRIFKKMLIQIVICLAIYSLFYLVKNNNYIFSEDLINKVNEILEYDINFSEMYTSFLETFNNANNEEQESQPEESIEQTTDEGIGGAEDEQEDVANESTQELSQMEQDALDIKNTINFINPIEGTITSTFGWRNPTTNTVPKYHTGLDIAANTGTEIKAATDGIVILSSSQGDYGNHLKIQINDVVIIYAHCSILTVNQGDNIVQGQKIAEVGSTR